MARTINDISAGIKSRFTENAMLQQLYGLDASKTFDEQFSSVSLEAILIYIVSVSVSALENIFDFKKSEIDRTVDGERYGYLGWYRKKALEFQWGDGITNDYSTTDPQFGEGTEYDNTGRTPEQIEELRIVKYAVAVDNGMSVDLKVAAQQDERPYQLSPVQLDSVRSYFNRIKPAGIYLNVISDPADRLKLEMNIRYNADVMDSQGVSIADGIPVVQNAIEGYLDSLEYNGEFISTKLVDALQAVNGIDAVVITGAFLKHASFPVEDITSRVAVTPQSGYLILSDFTDDGYQYGVFINFSTK